MSPQNRPRDYHYSPFYALALRRVFLEARPGFWKAQHEALRKAPPLSVLDPLQFSFHGPRFHRSTEAHESLLLLLCLPQARRAQLQVRLSRHPLELPLLLIPRSYPLRVLILLRQLSLLQCYVRIRQKRFRHGKYELFLLLLVYVWFSFPLGRKGVRKIILRRCRRLLRQVQDLLRKYLLGKK